MSTANSFKQELGAELARALGPSFRFYKSRRELRRETDHGHESVVLAGSNKWSPLISVSFYFGVCFSAAAKIEKLLQSKPLAYYHIHQYSLNVRHMAGLGYEGPCTFEVDLTAPSPGLREDLARAVTGMAFPFFERFRDMRVARDALVANDWCLGGRTSWRHVLLLDAALHDLAHFRDWTKQTLTEFELQQARPLLQRLRENLGASAQASES